MKNVIIAMSLAITTLFASACKQETAPAASAPSATHASEHAVPGSYEDWCDEHQVPESMCTRCNPSLSAAFRATGDWCEEHGLPESQCRLCNPNLKIVRPPQKRGE